MLSLEEEGEGEREERRKKEERVGRNEDAWSRK